MNSFNQPQQRTNTFQNQVEDIQEDDEYFDFEDKQEDDECLEFDFRRNEREKSEEEFRSSCKEYLTEKTFSIENVIKVNVMLILLSALIFFIPITAKYVFTSSVDFFTQKEEQPIKRLARLGEGITNFIDEISAVQIGNIENTKQNEIVKVNGHFSNAIMTKEEEMQRLCKQAGIKEADIDTCLFYYSTYINKKESK